MFKLNYSKIRSKPYNFTLESFILIDLKFCLKKKTFKIRMIKLKFENETFLICHCSLIMIL